jgi:hypothetical protein
MSSIFGGGYGASSAMKAPQQEGDLGSIEQIFHIPHECFPATSLPQANANSVPTTRRP